MKHELNSQNTKQMLCDTLLSLLEKKSISKITVSEIVSLCKLNRKTFYYHFSDVYDLFEWYLNNEINTAITLLNPCYDLDNTILYSIQYMNQQTYLRNCINCPIARDKLSNILNKTIYPVTLQMIQELESSHGKTIEADFKEFLAISLTRITVLSILDAIEKPENYDVEKMKLYLTMIMDTSVNGFFQQI